MARGKLDKFLAEIARYYLGIFLKKGESETASGSELFTPKRRLPLCVAYCTIPQYGCWIMHPRWNSTWWRCTFV
jgi:hypothetical protein